MLYPWLILILAYGACVGSFLNVVILRLPEGLSLVRPPSSCPKCGNRLAWYDNVPILGWIMLGGRCRNCKKSISVQYPLVEAATALLFGLTFACYYLFGLRDDFSAVGFVDSWPVLLVHLMLVAGLFAATVIDARLFIIPIDIPNTVSLSALIVLPAAAAWLPEAVPLMPTAEGWRLGAAAGGLIGLSVALIGLWRGWLPRSFEISEQDAAAQVPDAGPEQWLAYEHPRREVLKECLYVVWPLAGAVVGAVVAGGTGWADAVPPPAVAAAGVVWGYLCGAALVWGIRILGTLGFGKEAMGLGDVHLMGAIGAVLGAYQAAIVFFVAPFIGLAATALVAGVGSMVRGQVRVVPYGPYLAAAAVVWMFFTRPLVEVFVILFAPR